MARLKYGEPFFHPESITAANIPYKDKEYVFFCNGRLLSYCTFPLK